MIVESLVVKSKCIVWLFFYFIRGFKMREGIVVEKFWREMFVEE